MIKASTIVTLGIIVDVIVDTAPEWAPLVLVF
jgi:hypothetical protein